MTREEKFRFIQQQASSGQSQDAFCKRYSLKLSTFRKWKYLDLKKPGPKHPAFIDLVESREKSTSVIKIICGKFQIQVSEDFSPGLLRSILEVIS